MAQTNANSRACLTEHDQHVLDSIFNPLELTSSLNGAINPDISVDIVDAEPDTVEGKQSKVYELEVVQLAEQNQLKEALEHFELALKAAPRRASVYNNRAQALRLTGNDAAAFEDLNRAIALAATTQPKTKCHALCQRGVLYRKRENLDLARADFEAAAQLGSNFAREQLVEINPYAALCNQMLRQAFDKLK